MLNSEFINFKTHLNMSYKRIATLLMQKPNQYNSPKLTEIYEYKNMNKLSAYQLTHNNLYK